MNNIAKVKQYFISFSIDFHLIEFFLVCTKTIDAFADTLSDSEKTDPEKIDKAFKKYCSKVKVDTKEHRLVNISKSFLFFGLIYLI
jgi:hypothetical protein